MATKKIEVDIDVQSNTKGAIQELRELRLALRDAAAGSKEFDEISARIRDVEDSIEGAKLQAEDFAGAMEAAPGPVGELARGIKQLQIATSNWGAALRAAGVGLLVTTIGLLVNAFSKNEDAMKRLQPLFEGLEQLSNAVFRALEPVIALFVDLGTRAIPFVTTAFSGLFAAFDGLITFVKSSIMDFGTIASGVGNILLGIFTLDVDRIKKGLNDATTAYRNAGTAIVATYQRTQKGSQELTQSERKEAADRAAIRQKEAEDTKRAAEEQARLLRQQGKEAADLAEQILRRNQSAITQASLALTDAFADQFYKLIQAFGLQETTAEGVTNKYVNALYNIMQLTEDVEQRAVLANDALSLIMKELPAEAYADLLKAHGAETFTDLQEIIGKVLDAVEAARGEYFAGLTDLANAEKEYFNKFRGDIRENARREADLLSEWQVQEEDKIIRRYKNGEITEARHQDELGRIRALALENRGDISKRFSDEQKRLNEIDQAADEKRLKAAYDAGIVKEEEYNQRLGEIRAYYRSLNIQAEVEGLQLGQEALTRSIQQAEEARNQEDIIKRERLLAYAEFARSIELGLNDWSETLRNKAEAAEGKRRDRLRKTYKTVALAELAIGSAGAVFDIWTKYAQERAAINLRYAITPGGALNPLAMLEKRIALVRAIAGTTLVGVQTGIATAKIRSEKLGGVSAAGVGGDGGGGSALFAGAQRGIPSVAAPQINTGAGINPTQQLADTLSGITNKPIRAYVVSSDISSQQALDRRTNRAATFS